MNRKARRRKAQLEREIDNMVLVCGDCAPKPDPLWASCPPEYFLGKDVKLGFPSDDPRFGDEHMWVNVTKSCNGGLVGKLDSTPICSDTLKRGSIIEFTPDRIEAVWADEAEGGAKCTK